MKRFNSLTFGIFILLAFACNQENFNSKIWKEASSPNHLINDNRDKMLSDLLRKNIFQGKDRTQIINLLGEPEVFADTSSDELYYTVRIEYGFIGIDPEYIKYLVITLNKQDKFETYRIVEYK